MNVYPIKPTYHVRAYYFGERLIHKMLVKHGSGMEWVVSGESCILPAAIGAVDIVPEDETTLVACYVPDPARRVISPLREAGYSDGDIQSLGEVGI